MCNGGGIDIPASVVVTGVVVLGLGAVVTSPIWVPGMILYGAAYSASAGVEATVKGVQYRRTTHVLRKIRKRMLQRVKAGEWQAYLQMLYDRMRENSSKENLHELGVAMLIANDTIKAEQSLSAALEAPAQDSRHGQARQASVHFARGVVNQELRDYDAAIQDFAQAIQRLREAKSKEDPLPPQFVAGAQLPQLTAAECLNSMAYAKYLNALYKVMHEDDFRATDSPPTLVRTRSAAERSAEAKGWLQSAIQHSDEAISLTEGDPRGMFYFNRGKAKYFLALISNMEKEDDGEEKSTHAFALSADENSLMLQALDDFNFAVGTQNFGTTAEGHAMRAQTLAALGRAPDALEASVLADSIDPKVFSVDLSSPLQLITPWPLPQPPQDDAPHEFVEKSFHRPHYCDHCLKLITNFRNAHCCQKCQFRVHRACLAKAKKLRTCWNEKKEAGMSFVQNATQGKETQAPETHVHIMQQVYFHKPTWCDVCSGMCYRPHGYTCVECRFRVHTDCIGSVTNCVMKDTGTKLREIQDERFDVNQVLKHELRGIPMPTAPPARITILARTLNGQEITVSVNTTDTVLALKKEILRHMGSALPASHLGLLFGELPLKKAADLASVADVGLENGSMVSTIAMSDQDAIDHESISAFDYLELKSTGPLQDQS